MVASLLPCQHEVKYQLHTTITAKIEDVLLRQNLEICYKYDYVVARFLETLRI